MFLSEVSKSIVLNLARDAIKEFLSSGNYLEIVESDFIEDEDKKCLLEKGACFVSLYISDELRGCVGTVIASDKLYKNIIRYAIYAATEDDRFDGVSIGEVGELKIEISILTPMILIENFDDFEIGEDGLMIELGSSSGLLLPQVATKWGLSKQEFLEQLCVKAGIDKGGYKGKASKLFKFSAEIVTL